MVPVSAGSFEMGCSDKDRSCSGDEEPQHSVYLDAFEIDETEVTVSAYEACVSSGSCTAPKRGDSCNWGVTGRGEHPVNCVT